MNYTCRKSVVFIVFIRCVCVHVPGWYVEVGEQLVAVGSLPFYHVVSGD